MVFYWLQNKVGGVLESKPFFTPGKYCRNHTSYLSSFLHEQNFWRINFTAKKPVNYGKIHSKLPIFCVITAKYTVNCQIFALNLKKNLHRPKKIYTNIFVGFVTNMRYGHNFSVVRNLLCDYCHCPLQAPCSEVHVIHRSSSSGLSR